MGSLQRIGRWFKSLFIKPGPQPLSLPARKVLKTLYALERAIAAIPNDNHKQFVQDAAKEHHRALDGLRRYHEKDMPSPGEIELLGGPGTKEDDDSGP